MMKTSRITLAMILAICALTWSAARSAVAGEPAAAPAAKAVEIVVVKDADGLSQFAAAELQRYVQRLFGTATNSVTVNIVTEPSAAADAIFLLCTSSQRVKALDQETLPQLSEQGFLLRTTKCQGKPALAIVGGSSRAMMWGVYELAERYGVRYLLSGDIYPEKQQPFSLPEINQVFEPAFTARWFKTMGDFAMGMEGWGMADYRPFLDQLAKLKFNRIRIGGGPSAPFLDLQLKGVKRQSAVLWYGEHFPITPDMPGYKLFGKETEFWNPDLLTPDAPCDQLIAAGQRHMHELTAYAQSRGIDASAVWSLLDFSKDFQSVVPGAQTVQQLGQLTVAPGPTIRPDNPELLDLGGTVIRTMLNEFPEVHSHGFPVGTEFPSWIDLYEWAWKELDKQYGIESVLPLEEVMRRAGQRSDHWEGGAARSVREVKGHITGLYYLLRLWNSPDVVPKTRKPDARLVVYEVAEELWPIVARILPKNSELNIVMDYNPTRVLRRRNVIATAPAKDVPTTMVLTLHDDSVGTLPLLTTSALHELVGDMRKAGITGFGTRQWLISDHDPSVAYLSKAAWNADTTPEAVFSDQVRTVCGESAVAPMLKMFHEVETVTTRLEDHGMGITFPHSGMIMSWWSPDALQPPFFEDQAIYQRALDAARSVPPSARPEGKAYVDYWIGRLHFAVGYFDALKAAQKAAIAEKAAKAAKEKGDDREYRSQLAEALRHTKAARDAAFQAIDAYAQVARDRADSGAIATMAEFVCRQIDRKTAELRAEQEKLP